MERFRIPTTGLDWEVALAIVVAVIVIGIAWSIYTERRKKQVCRPSPFYPTSTPPQAHPAAFAHPHAAMPQPPAQHYGAPPQHYYHPATPPLTLGHGWGHNRPPRW